MRALVTLLLGAAALCAQGTMTWNGVTMTWNGVTMTWSTSSYSVTTNESIRTAAFTAQVGQHFAVSSDYMGSTDLPSGRFGHTAAPFESLIISDLGAGVSNHFASPTEPNRVTDALSSSSGRFGSFTESRLTADLYVASAAHYAVSNDLSVPLNQALGVGAHFAGAVEPLSAIDVSIGQKNNSTQHLTASTLEALITSDAGLGHSAHIVAVLDSSLITDSMQRSLSRFANTSESLSVFSTPSVLRVFGRVLTESLGLSEASPAPHATHFASAVDHLSDSQTYLVRVHVGGTHSLTVKGLITSYWLIAVW